MQRIMREIGFMNKSYVILQLPKELKNLFEHAADYGAISSTTKNIERVVSYTDTEKGTLLKAIHSERKVLTATFDVTEKDEETESYKLFLLKAQEILDQSNTKAELISHDYRVD